MTTTLKVLGSAIALAFTSAGSTCSATEGGAGAPADPSEAVAHEDPAPPLDAAYGITPLDEGVAVNLEGGPAKLVRGRGLLGLSDPAPPPDVRTIRGKVVDRRGRPMSGVAVVAGRRLDQFLGSDLTADGGAMTDEDGAFAFAVKHGESLAVLAMHHTAGWSSLLEVPAGTEDGRADLRLQALPAGPTTICAEAEVRHREPLGFRCQVTDVSDDGSVQVVIEGVTAGE